MVSGEVQYIGDGVYLKYENGQYVLMANSHINPTDTIYLELDVLDNLLKFVRLTTGEEDRDNE